MVVGSSLDGTAAVLHRNYGYEVMNIVFLESPIRCVKFIDFPPASGGSVFLTASWTEVKYWDTRCIGRHVGCLECDAPIQTVDVNERMMTIGTKNRDIHVVDLLCSSKFLGTGKSPLANQTTVVKCLPGTYGLAIGSAGGECAIRRLHGDAWKYNFVPASGRQDEVVSFHGDNRNCDWKCYDEDLPDPPPGTPNWDIPMGKRAVNSISFHGQYNNLLSTATSDGTLKIWDFQSQKLVSTFVPSGGAIRATSFNKDSSILAYAVTTGDVHPCNPKEEQDKIILHKMKDAEIGRVRPEL
jgi:mRNA export factor